MKRLITMMMVMTSITLAGSSTNTPTSTVNDSFLDRVSILGGGIASKCCDDNIYYNSFVGIEVKKDIISFGTIVTTNKELDVYAKLDLGQYVYAKATYITGNDCVAQAIGAGVTYKGFFIEADSAKRILIGYGVEL